MNIDRLKEFVVLAECLNFSKAANLLYMAQPVLSRHINELEAEFHTKFFIRDTHKTVLTPAGEIAAQEFRRIIEVYDDAMNIVTTACDQENEAISFGFLGLAVQPFIKKFVNQFSKNHSSIQVSYSVGHLMDLLTAVQANQHDLALVTDIIPQVDKNLEILQLAEDPQYICLPAGDSLYDRKSVSISELSGHPMIGFDSKINPHTSRFHEEMFKEHGAELNVVKKIANIDSALFQVQMGDGAFLIPRHLLNFAKDAHTIPISDADATSSLSLIWKKDNPKPALKVFIREFRKFFSSLDMAVDAGFSYL